MIFRSISNSAFLHSSTSQEKSWVEIHSVVWGAWTLQLYTDLSWGPGSFRPHHFCPLVEKLHKSYPMDHSQLNCAMWTPIGVGNRFPGKQIENRVLTWNCSSHNLGGHTVNILFDKEFLQTKAPNSAYSRFLQNQMYLFYFNIYPLLLYLKNLLLWGTVKSYHCYTPEEHQHCICGSDQQFHKSSLR